jgi:hypothetical protein
MRVAGEPSSSGREHQPAGRFQKITARLHTLLPGHDIDTALFFLVDWMLVSNDYGPPAPLSQAS